MDIRDRLRSALKDAMRTRDSASLSALRSALSAIDNAEAIEVTDDGGPTKATHETLAGTTAGAASTEVPRRELSQEEMAERVQREIDERRAAADEYEARDRDGEALRLRAEAAVLEAVLEG